MTALALEPGETRRFRPPTPPRPRRDLPLIRVALALRRNSLCAWPERAYDEMIMHRRFLGVDCWLVNDPEGARRVLRERSEDYVQSVAVARMLRPIGDGLLVAEGQAWRAQRRQVAPHFSPASVERMLPVMHAAADTALSALPPSGTANLAQIFEGAAIDTIGRVLFSAPLVERAARFRGLMRRYFKGVALGSVWDFIARSRGDLAWALRAREAWSQEWLAEIDTLIAERGASTGATADLFEVLAGEDPEGLRDQVATLLSTGFESSARTMFWAAYLLSHDEAEQEAVRSEVAQMPPHTVRTLGDLKAWPRLTRVVQETMRLYPPGSTLIRSARIADTICGHAIAPGSIVIVCPWVMHRHRAHWDRPDDFIPERFAHRTDMMRDGTYLPFGMGKRVCVGAAMAQTEVVVMLAHLLARWRMRIDDPHPVLPVAVTSTVPDHEPAFRLMPVGGPRSA